MAVNVRHMRALPHDVFAVLADGWMYSNWVVGTSHMRAVESAWPAPGSRLFHAAGPWPFATRDDTVVDAVQVDRRLELTARGRPFGTADIVIELAEDAGGCTVTMTETPASGPGKWLHSPVTEALLRRRNTEALDRLAALSERRTMPSE